LKKVGPVDLNVFAKREFTLPLAASRVPWRLAANAFALVALYLLAIHLGHIGLGPDARSYYDAHGEHLYLGTLGDIAYAYSPAFAQAIAPLQALPFETFRAIIAGAELLALAYLVGPLPALGIALFQITPMWDEIAFSGNIQIVAAAVLVLALRGNALGWPFLLLTKVTPGIGILWPLMKRKWREAAIGVGVTVVIAGVSFVSAPHYWSEWISWMLGSVDRSGDRAGIPHIVRIALAAGLIWYAAHTDRIWLVPLAAAVAAPEGGGHWLLLLGMWPLWRESERQTAIVSATVGAGARGSSANPGGRG
jgi:hypothetical protein